MLYETVMCKMLINVYRKKTKGSKQGGCYLHIFDFALNLFTYLQGNVLDDNLKQLQLYH